MWPVKYPNLIKQKHTHARALTLINLRAQINQQGLNVLPFYIAADRALKKALQCRLVFSFHKAMVPNISTMAQLKKSIT